MGIDVGNDLGEILIFVRGFGTLRFTVGNVAQRQDLIAGGQHKHFKVKRGIRAVNRIDKDLLDLLHIRVWHDREIIRQMEQAELVFQFRAGKSKPRKGHRVVWILYDRMRLVLRCNKHLSCADGLPVKGTFSLENKVDLIAINDALIEILLLPRLGIAEGGNIKSLCCTVHIVDSIRIISTVTAIHRHRFMKDFCVDFYAIASGILMKIGYHLLFTSFRVAYEYRTSLL